MLVGCGAGGAIAAAFGAPLTGAFYAFELIIGAYSLANAVPVFAATLAATLVTRAIIGAPYVISAPEAPILNSLHYGALIGLGLVAAAVGVGAMRAAALIERAFRAVIPWRVLRPVAGGALLGVMALYTPQILGAGHGALGLDFYWPLTATELVVLILLKLFASMASLASGFRGGLFFASLFVGSLLGKLYAVVINFLFPWLGPRHDRLRAGRHGGAEHGDRRRPADHDLSRSREHRQPQRRRRRSRRLLRHDARGAGDLRLLVHHLASAPQGRDDPRRPGRRLAARSDGGEDDDPGAADLSRAGEHPCVPRGPSARQRQCRGRGRRGWPLCGPSPRFRGARPYDRGGRRRRPGRPDRAPARDDASIPTTTCVRRSICSAPRMPTRSP